MQANTSEILQALSDELSHRLEKLAKVFTWCSGILISITSGIIAATRSIQKFELNKGDRFVLSCIILTITIYGWLWIRENLKFETNVRNQIDKIFSEELSYPEIKSLRPDKARFGYKQVIILLGLIALFATWKDFFNI